MFTPKNIQGALEELYDLCDPDYMADMLVNYSEEFDDIYDIIAGDFLVVGLGEDDFCSLSPELMKQFEEHFHQPETFVRMGRSIMALPLPDDMVKKEDTPVKADSVPHKNNPDRDVL